MANLAIICSGVKVCQGGGDLNRFGCLKISQRCVAGYFSSDLTGHKQQRGFSSIQPSNKNTQKPASAPQDMRPRYSSKGFKLFSTASTTSLQTSLQTSDILDAGGAKIRKDVRNSRYCSSGYRRSSTTSSATSLQPGYVPEGLDASYSTAMFDDHRVANSSKTLWELIRARGIFWACSFPAFTNNAEQMLSITSRVLGQRLSEWLIRRCFYTHFVASDGESVQAISKKLEAEGVGTLLAVSIEDDVGQLQRDEGQKLLDHNLQTILTCMELSCELSGRCSMFQLKGSAIMRGDLLKQVSESVGDTIDPKVLDAFVAAMKGDRVDFRQLPGWHTLTPEDNAEILMALQRFQEVNELILQKDVLGMMDAEYTYMNPALRLLALAMMCVTSGDKNRVFYTYQAYLKNTARELEADLALMKSRGICFGAKLVRGAYLVKERQLALKGGYEDPVQPTFDATNASYHRCLDILLNEAARDQDRIRFIIASHNEDSVVYALNRINSLGLGKDCQSILFGQIYGMADYISYKLGHLGYSAQKSIPYGSLQETLPYLARRAQENRAIFENARREKQLLNKSLRDRILLRDSNRAAESS